MGPRLWEGLRSFRDCIPWTEWLKYANAVSQTWRRVVITAQRIHATETVQAIHYGAIGAKCPQGVGVWRQRLGSAEGNMKLRRLPGTSHFQTIIRRHGNSMVTHDNSDPNPSPLPFSFQIFPSVPTFHGYGARLDISGLYRRFIIRYRLPLFLHNHWV